MTEYSDLVVIARTSSFLFRDHQDDVIAIGRNLNAAFVLEGSIRKSGSSLRITAQLIETLDGTHEWSQSYDRELTVENLLDIQSEVAARVVEAIGMDTPRIARRATGREMTNADAYDQYLEGMFYLRQVETAMHARYGVHVYEAAIERFQAAIELEPNWARPYAAIGRTMVFRAGILSEDDEEAAYDWYSPRQSVSPGVNPAGSRFRRALQFSRPRTASSRLRFPGRRAAHAKAKELGDYIPWRYALYPEDSGSFRGSD